MIGKIIRIYKNKLRPRLKKILIGLVIFFVVFTLVGFFVIPPILKSILIKKLSENLHREVTITQINVNPYTLSTTVKGFKVKDPKGSETFVSFDELFINLQTLSVFKLALIFKEIRLTNPFVRISRHQDMSFNFSDLIEKKVETPPVEKGRPLRFSLNNIQLINGNIDFWDEPKQTKHTVKELNIGVPFLSNIPSQIDIFVHPAFSAKVNETPYAIQGKTKPFADSLETTFDINIKDFDIPYYLAYFPLKLNFKIVSAYLDTQTQLSFIQYKDKEPSVTVSGNVSLKKVALDDVKNNPLFRLPLIEIGIAPTEPLKKIFHLSKVSIQSPELEVQRNSKGALNIESLLPEKREAQPSPAPEKKKDQANLSIDIDEMQLTGGKISFSDLSRKKPFKTILDPIDLKVDHFSNGKEKKTNYLLSLKTEANETIKLEGDLSVDPMRVDGGIEVKSAVVKKYSPYYMDSILFDIEDGRLDFSTRYKYEKGEKEPIISLSGMSANLGSLRLKKRDEKEDFFKVPIISLKDTQLNLTWKELKLGSFFTEKGMLTFNRLSNGEFDLEKLFPPSPPKQEQAKQAPSKESEKPWLVKVGKVSLDQYTIKVEDRTTADPITLVADEINLKAENLSTAKGQRGNASLALRLNQKGTVSANGPFGINPIFGNLKMSLKGIDIRSLQPYFSDRVKIIIEDGNFSTAGNLLFSEQEGKGVQLTYKGDCSLANFASIDMLNAEDLLKWESLALNDVDIGYNPLYIHINGIALTNFYARLILHPDGSLNLQEVFEKEGQKKEAPTAPQPQKKESPPTKNQEVSTDIKIEKVTFQGGEIKFTDNYIKPNYSADMIELGGRISGLTSEETKVGEVDLRGKLGGGAPVEITGKINPLKKDFFMDLDVKFKDIELSPLTPYSGKYAGYPIEKGKLTMELKYLIDHRKLDAKNKFFFDQLTLGDKVESPNATKLPVKLAIALLKDRKGEINLDIPVSGSLDDPKFSIWGIILKIIVNLLAKAATSPFALLGAVFGGGEELSYIEFDYGVATITEPNLKKIDTLIKALSDRPALKLDIEGHVDLDRDREGLKQFLFQRKLKAQKLKEMLKKGEPAVPVDEAKIEPQEYQKYLKLAYKEEKFPKPKNILGMAKDIPAPEMEKLMLTYIEIKESDLRTLASQRAQKVKESIVKAGIQPERIFIIEPKSLAPEKKEKLKDSRVEFKLK